MHLANVGVIIVPDSSTACGASDVKSAVLGAEGRQNIGWKVLHAHFNHRPRRRWLNLPTALCDAPTAWSKEIATAPQTPCDACLRAHANAVPSRWHAPHVQRPGRLISMDVYTKQECNTSTDVRATCWVSTTTHQGQTKFTFSKRNTTRCKVFNSLWHVDTLLG